MFLLVVEWIVLSAFGNMSTVPSVSLLNNAVFFLVKSYFNIGLQLNIDPM